jgi:tricorn protease-like protein
VAAVIFIALRADARAQEAGRADPILTVLEAKVGLYSLAFAPDGNTLVVCGADPQVQVWDSRNRRVTHLRGHNQNVDRVAYSCDGSRWASASDDTSVTVWDGSTNEEIYTIKKHVKPVHGLAFSPDGKLLATGSEDFTIRLWDVATKHQVASLEGFGPIIDLKYAPDGNTIAMATKTGLVAIWDTAEPRKLLMTPVRHSKQILGLAYSPESRALASASEDGTVILWDVATGKVLREFNRYDAGVS